MCPFSMAMFSQSKFLPSHTLVHLKKETKNEKHIENEKRKKLPRKVYIPPVASSLPVYQSFSRHFYKGPEEEVFAMSLESPRVSRLSCSYDWLDRDQPSGGLSTSSYLETSSTTTASALELEGGHEKVLPVTPTLTPGQLSTNPVTPQRDKKVGRGEVLSRYVHKYEFEDFMEYAVDIFEWKKSLEEQYQVGDWEIVQTEVTPRMRLTLLDWMVDITRQLEFTLETWCLAVNYLDRFLETQLLAKDCLQLAGLTALWLGAKQEELNPPSTEELVSLSAATYSVTNFKHMELILLAKLKFCLAAPTAAFHLSLLVAVEDEKDWSEDLSRHLVEMVIEDHLLARMLPSRIAHAVFKVIKGCDTTAIRILEGSCPKCEPYNTDQWCKDFLQACVQRVADILSV
eukprot:GFUD01039248.1.p1 GENE.GFUD01039248.1~~GFUD01039248.1.p1  ORF type:complete len:400 (+),score=59.17 GFUD01039248.1:81-1280(+)